MVKKLFDTYVPSRNENSDTESWNLAKGLGEYRRQNKLTQGAMAELMQVSIRSYQGYERGEHAIPTTAIETLANNSNVDLLFLLTGNHPKPSTEALEAWARQITEATFYVQQNAPHLSKQQVIKLIIAYFKLDATSALFSSDRIDALIEMT